MRLFPRSEKTFLIFHPDNLQAGISFGNDYGFKICTGARYLGGFIWDEYPKPEWTIVYTAVKKICMINKNDVKYPQESQT